MGQGEQPQEVSIRALLEREEFKLELLQGDADQAKGIRVPSLQKPGLALAGHLESIHHDRLQVIGFSETSYLAGLPAEMSQRRVDDLCDTGVPCVVVTRGLEVPPCLEAACRQRALPLLRTSLSTAELIDALGDHLSATLSPTTSIHGVLVDVFGVGILLLGRSGVGKSETALELVMHGHRLVADDIVQIRRRHRSLYGVGPEIIKHHMEIRGLGILNIKDLFGISAVRESKKVELVAELVEWDPEEEYDRLGVDEQNDEILGIRVQKIRLPVRPGRNMARIIEVAARNQLLKFQGHHSAKEFQERLIRAISANKPRTVDGDVE